MSDRTWVATVKPYDAATFPLDREKANAKRRLRGDWLTPLPTDVSDVEVVSIDTRVVGGETEATITMRLIE